MLFCFSKNTFQILYPASPKTSKTEAYLRHYQTSMIEIFFFWKILNCYCKKSSLSIFDRDLSTSLPAVPALK